MFATKWTKWLQSNAWLTWHSDYEQKKVPSAQKLRQQHTLCQQAVSAGNRQCTGQRVGHEGNWKISYNLFINFPSPLHRGQRHCWTANALSYVTILRGLQRCRITQNSSKGWYQHLHKVWDPATGSVCRNWRSTPILCPCVKDYLLLANRLYNARRGSSAFQNISKGMVSWLKEIWIRYSDWIGTGAQTWNHGNPERSLDKVANAPPITLLQEEQGPIRTSCKLKNTLLSIDNDECPASFYNLSATSTDRVADCISSRPA